MSSEISNDQFFHRIPLLEKDYCSPAIMGSAFQFLGVEGRQIGLINFVKDRIWGTELKEKVNMAKHSLGKSHYLAKPDWSTTELQDVLNHGGTVAILNVMDELNRICRIADEEVGGIDGHYVAVLSIGRFPDWNLDKDIDYALIIDPSDHDIVIEGKLGVKLTDCDNIYFLPVDSLDKIWHDTNKDGSENNHWALVMLRKTEDSKFLEKYRNQGKINTLEARD